MKKTKSKDIAGEEKPGRVLARALATDLRWVRGGMPGIHIAGTGAVTYPPPGYDTTTQGADGDSY